MPEPVPVPPRAERERGVRQFLLLALGVLAALDALLETGRGNWAVAVPTATVALLTPLVLWLARRPRCARLPEYYALAILSVFVLLGGLTQWHVASNLVWLPLYPFAFYFLGGLRIGVALALLGGAALAGGYLAYPAWQAATRVDLNHFIQVLFAYGMGALIAHLYERVRTRQESLLVEQATLDYLTRLPNRRGFSQLAEVLARQAQRQRQPLAVVLFDLDDFKGVNDRYGHAAGDALLRGAARLARAQVRASDVLARWGGEEFVVLLPACDRACAARRAETLRAALGAHDFSGIGRVTASFGVAEAAAGESVDALIQRADRALYRAKHAGKNRVEVETGEPDRP
jgi:diguanylate cyclase (GGDEF)-like protein